MSDTIVVRPVENEVIVSSDGVTVIQGDNTATIVTVGEQGPAGPPGPKGDSGDKTFKQDFTNASSVTVSHNLNKYPAVTIINSAGAEVEGDPNYIDANTLTISFSASFSGSVLCN